MSKKQTENEMTSKANELLDEEFELDDAALEAVAGGFTREIFDSYYVFDTFYPHDKRR